MACGIQTPDATTSYAYRAYLFCTLVIKAPMRRWVGWCVLSLQHRTYIYPHATWLFSGEILSFFVIRIVPERKAPRSFRLWNQCVQHKRQNGNCGSYETKIITHGQIVNVSVQIQGASIVGGFCGVSTLRGRKDKKRVSLQYG